ncbi:hypothetical protein QBC47DRAFT_356769 [Echria macrotheca]|uniref:Uncharacterized protein n=1 Tax=Echria macrotheca TaxID=438768 RepID=A0AAJ0BJ03_9PEZI|nr:hypothetical protein QBC47DRAFT_356769 [Echria macrotheca]
MSLDALLHRAGAALRRNWQRAAKKTRRRRDMTRAGGSNSSSKPQIIHPSLAPEGTAVMGGVGTNGTTAADDVKTITRAEMQETADNQDASMFFAKLPLEIRRQIYREVWGTYLKSRRRVSSSPSLAASSSSARSSYVDASATSYQGADMRLHIYTDGSTRGTFRHTQCRIDCSAATGPDGAADAQVIDPWPFDMEPQNMPPMWFWFAWIMRLHWDKHWKCQHAVMKRWDSRTGSAREAAASPFLPVFLTCKKMYWEAVACLFETVTPVFTSSEDAYRFFIQRPHPFLGSVRSLEFCFTNPNDHLFLAQVQRDVRNDPPPDEAAPAAGTVPHPCMVMPCRLDVFGQQLWRELVEGVQASIPGLRDLDVTIGGRMAHDDALARFGRRHAEGDEEANQEGVDTWTLPGRLAVLFKSEDQLYVQQGTKLIRQ